jgi:uncharacterized protein (DUF697 family)
MPNPLTDYNPEWETFEGEAPAQSDTSGHEMLGETIEIELASELLAVTSEQELDQFLGDLIRNVGRSVGSILHSPLGQAIGRGLKGVIKSALPLAGGALGTLAGGPLGASIGSGLASMAGQAFGLELEGLSHEDQEFEATKRYVRFASEAVKTAASASPVSDPVTCAQAAIVTAAQRTAPGLLRFVPRAFANSGGHVVWPYPKSQPAHRNQTAANIHMRSPEDAMHDIGRVQLETDLEMENYEGEQFEWPGEAEAIFNEAEEMELASQLMEVSSEQELDQFLGDLIRRAGRALGGFVNSPAGQAIGGILKGAAKQILPHAAGALGTFVGGPLGAQIGSGLASMTSGEFGMEAEAWNQEDREYEGAKQFVRVAADTVRSTLAEGPDVDPRVAAQAAIAQAAHARAPGLLQSAPPSDMRSYAPYGTRSDGGGHSGRWKRSGNKIVLYGV